MTKPTKILHILGSANRGGTEANTYDLVSHMAGDFLNEVCFLGKNLSGKLKDSIALSVPRMVEKPASQLRFSTIDSSCW